MFVKLGAADVEAVVVALVVAVPDNKVPASPVELAAAEPLVEIVSVLVYERYVCV
jgi:hypothetical protein